MVEVMWVIRRRRMGASGSSWVVMAWASNLIGWPESRKQDYRVSSHDQADGNKCTLERIAKE